jgi:glycosyltransferase involved in cell wall biosynthesis
VSDYTRLVAEALAEAGDEVHVWAPGPCGASKANPGVTVHRLPDHFGPRSLPRLDADLRRRGPRLRILVQYVPHAFGWRSMNVPFCAWLGQRAAAVAERVEVMVHEPFLAFREGSWRQDLAALVHRLMTVLLLRSVRRVWVSIPFWEQCWRPYAVGRRLPFEWLPVPSTVAVRQDSAAVTAVRARYAGESAFLVGHFGTFGKPVSACLAPAIDQLLRQQSGTRMLLLGRGGGAFLRALLREHPGLTGRVEAAGELEAGELSSHLQACDLLLQPYPEGATSRRTSLMAGLSHGKAIVTNSGRLSETIWQASGAVVLAPISSEGLGREAATLLADPRRRESLGSAAKVLYCQKFDLRHTIKALRGA